MRAGLGSGFLWLSAQSVARQFLLFGLFVVLGRLLSPADFGVAAVATATLVILQAVSAQGIAQIVVQRPDLSEHEADVLFTFNLALSIGLSSLAVLASAAVWLWSGRIDLTQAVITAMTLTLPISALYEVHQARLSRDFSFGLIARKGIAGQAAGSAVAVAAAFAGFGVWSLVIQYYCLVVIELVLVRRWSSWTARLALDRRVVRDTLALGGYLFGSRLVLALEARSAELVLSVFAGQAATGYLRIGRSMFDVVVVLLGSPLRSLALPLLASIQSDARELRKTYLMLSGATAWLFLGPFAVVFVWGPEMVTLTFGQTWSESGWILRLLALQGIEFGLFFLTEPLLVAMGRGRDVLTLRVLRTVTLLASLLTGAVIGANAILIGQVVGTLLAMPIMFIFVRRAVPLPVARYVRIHAPPIAAAISVAVFQTALRPWTDPAGVLVSLAVCCVLAGLLYLSLFLALGDQGLVGEVKRFLRRRG